METTREIEKYFSNLAKEKKKEFTVTGLLPPNGNGNGWSGGQINLGHTQGIACWKDWLVLTNNQKSGAGYIALCERTSDRIYEYTDHIRELDEKNTLYYHPGGIQMLDHCGETWVVVPFEKDGYRVKTGVNTGLPTYYEESEIRFYCIKNSKLKLKKTIIKRGGKKAGSAGITNYSEKSCILGIAYEKNSVDFYRGSSEFDFEEEPFSTLPYCKKRPPYVNAMSLLSDENDNIYVVGLTGRWWERSDFVYVSKVDLSNENAVIDGSLYVALGSKLRSELSGPSFRWGGSLGLQDGKLSVIAAERMIEPEGKTQVVVL